MKHTKLLFLENTYLYAIPIIVLEKGIDEYGSYFVADRTIFYPQGGGQPNDHGFISIANKKEIKICGAKYVDNQIRHYLESELPDEFLQKETAMHILQDTRKINAAYHSAGHWISQLVLESLRLPIFPIKGHHFPNEAYIEFEGNISCITYDTLGELRMAMQIDMQANLSVRAEYTTIGSTLFESALLPKNFSPPANKPLRFTQIEGYRWLPCGGTHIGNLRDIKSVKLNEFYKKGNKIRLPYTCEVWETIAS